MSISKLVEYTTRLVFGDAASAPKTLPPPPLFPLVLRLKSHHVHVNDTIRNGGLVNMPHMIAGDLNLVLDHFEKDAAGDPIIRTSLVANFYNHLLVALSRRQQKSSPAQQCSRNDDAVLKAILEGDTTTRFDYTCAPFWGDLARRLLTQQRPVPEMILMSAHAPPGHLRNVLRLYDVTCKSMGRWLDPLSLHLVAHDEYVDAVHWQHLEEWLSTDHPLAEAIVQLVRRAIEDVLDGRRPDWLPPHDRLDMFLDNVAAMQSAIDPVYGSSTPPRVVDVFQRLLALTRFDSVWQTVPGRSSSHGTARQKSNALDLTLKILLLEKQNRLLLQQTRN